jgi:hypothetical protein
MRWGVQRGPALAASSRPLRQASKQVPFSGTRSSAGPRPDMRTTVAQPCSQPRCMSVKVDRAAICSSVSPSQRPCFHQHHISRQPTSVSPATAAHVSHADATLEGRSSACDD